MKNRIVALLAIILLMSFSTGLLSGCNINSIIPFGNTEDYDDDRDDRDDDDDEEETKKTKKSIEVSDDDPVIPSSKSKKNPEKDEDPGDDGDDGEEGGGKEEKETTAATSAANTTKKKTVKIGKTKVINAYKKSFKTEFLGKVTSRYPKVSIEGVSTTAVNYEIKGTIAPKCKKNKVSYSYYIGKNYVSIFITVMYDSPAYELDHYIYNISRRSGKKMSRGEMLGALNIKSSTFESRAKKAIQKYWKKNSYIGMDKAAYKKAISSSTLSRAVPYVNKSGKLCYLVRSMELPVGGNYYDVCGTC